LSNKTTLGIGKRCYDKISALGMKFSHGKPKLPKIKADDFCVFYRRNYQFFYLGRDKIMIEFLIVGVDL